MGGSERRSPSRKALTTELEHVPPGAHPSDAAALAERANETDAGGLESQTPPRGGSGARWWQPAACG